jgi:hypothetical protein
MPEQEAEARRLRGDILRGELPTRQYMADTLERLYTKLSKAEQELEEASAWEAVAKMESDRAAKAEQERDYFSRRTSELGMRAARAEARERELREAVNVHALTWHNGADHPYAFADCPHAPCAPLRHILERAALQATQEDGAGQ